MFTILHAFGMFVADLFKSRYRLEAENLFLRHQLNVALRRAPSRRRLHGIDRALLVWMTRLWPSLLGATQVVQPETILRWHRSGFKAFWRCKSRNRAGRPKIDRSLRDLIQRMSRENPLWGASRIHGEPYSTYPNDDLKTGCLALFESEKAQGTELIAIIGALQEYIELEEERLRREREETHRRYRETS